jgi:hypothetical protein
MLPGNIVSIGKFEKILPATSAQAELSYVTHQIPHKIRQ